MLSPRLPRLAAVAALAALTIAASAGCGGTNYDQTKEKWSFISATIIEPSCATVNCHSAITKQSGLDLSSSEIGYKMLVGTMTDAGTIDGGTYFVYPDYPQYSLLITRLNAVGSLRMPPDNPLPQADIALIEKWISDGAKDN